MVFTKKIHVDPWLVQNIKVITADLYRYRIRFGALTSQRSLEYAKFKLKVAQNLIEFFSLKKCLDEFMKLNCRNLIYASAREALITKKFKDYNCFLSSLNFELFDRVFESRKDRFLWKLIKEDVRIFKIIIQTLSIKNNILNVFRYRTAL